MAFLEYFKDEESLAAVRKKLNGLAHVLRVGTIDGPVVAGTYTSIPINATEIPGLIAISGSDLYVVDADTGDEITVTLSDGVNGTDTSISIVSHELLTDLADGSFVFKTNYNDPIV